MFMFASDYYELLSVVSFLIIFNTTPINLTLFIMPSNMIIETRDFFFFFLSFMRLNLNTWLSPSCKKQYMILYIWYNHNVLGRVLNHSIPRHMSKPIASKKYYVSVWLSMAGIIHLFFLLGGETNTSYWYWYWNKASNMKKISDWLIERDLYSYKTTLYRQTFWTASLKVKLLKITSKLLFIHKNLNVSILGFKSL